MQNILLNDGSLSTVNGYSGMIELIRERFSYELADSLEEIVSDRIEDLNHEKVNVESELRSYEEDVEELDSTLWDIRDIAEEILDYMDTNKRMDKNKFRNMVEEIKYKAHISL